MSGRHVAGRRAGPARAPRCPRGPVTATRPAKAVRARRADRARPPPPGTVVVAAPAWRRAQPDLQHACRCPAPCRPPRQPRRPPGDRAPRAPTPALPRGSANQQFNYALGLVKQADYPGAEVALEVLSRKPTPTIRSPASAQYWLGQNLLFAQQIRRSQPRLSPKAISAFPAGPKAPEDLLVSRQVAGAQVRPEEECLPGAGAARPILSERRAPPSRNRLTAKKSALAVVERNMDRHSRASGNPGLRGVPRPRLGSGRRREMTAPDLDRSLSPRSSMIGGVRAAPFIAIGGLRRPGQHGAGDLRRPLEARGGAAGKPGRSIVDHRLAAGKRRRGADRLPPPAARDIPHAVLAWQGEKPATGIQEAARAARYGLLARWCEAKGCLHLLLAHHRGDQAETYSPCRRAGSLVPMGWPGSSAVRELPRLRLVRPLLGIAKARLVALLDAERQQYLHDPSNHNLVFERSRLRMSATVDEDARSGGCPRPGRTAWRVGTANAPWPRCWRGR